MSKIRVAINGFGRIGRNFFKIAQEYQKDIEIVAVNDIASIDNAIYLLKYDSVYGKSDFPVEKKSDTSFTIGGNEVAYVSEKDPTNLPWAKMKVDVVVESTGLFTSADKASAHLKAGAKRVVISAPSKDEAGAAMQSATILMGINEDKFSTSIVTSNASCTTNSASPIIAILDEAIGIEKAVLSTTHAYTASQSLIDGPSKKDIREGRAAAINIVPSSTGAAIAVTLALPQLAGKFDGISSARARSGWFYRRCHFYFPEEYLCRGSQRYPPHSRRRSSLERYFRRDRRPARLIRHRWQSQSFHRRAFHDACRRWQSGQSARMV